MARIFFERRHVPDEALRLLEMLDQGVVPPGTAGDCAPPIDVVETAETLEIVMDLPGVAADGVQVIFARNTLVIAGQKAPRSCEHREAGFHLAERAFGRFARAIRVAAAYDAGAADATLKAGELRIVLPRIADRRGAEIRIPVRAD